MKSLNVKKIAAVAAGAAMVGAAFAGAVANVDQTAIGNFWPSIWSNGAPGVQVVVGSLANPSDGIAAANIAAVIGNLAFTTGGAAEPAAGATVSPVNVQVTAPVGAVAAGEFGFTSWWGDDRIGNEADTTYNRTASKPAYNGNLAPTKEVSSTQSSMLVDGTVDTKGKYSGTITQREFVNIFGQTDFSSTVDKYIVRNPAAWYVLSFSPGLPFCLDATATSCATNSRLDRAGIKLRFLGQEYLVTDVTVSTATTPNTFSSMTLSQASIDQIVEVGKEVSDSAGNKVKVESISAPQTTASVSSVGLRVTNAAGLTELVTVTSGAAPVKILSNLYVQVPDSFYVASGVSTARVIFASGSVRMVQNTTIDETIFGKWQVSFTTNNVSASAAISKLQIGNDFQPSILGAGESVEIIKGAPGYKWTFIGNTLVSADYTTLSVEPVVLDSIQVNGNTTSCSYSAVKFTSSRTDAFRFGNDQVATTWWLVKNRTNAGCNLHNGNFLFLNSSSIYAIANTTNSFTGLTTFDSDVNASGAAIDGAGATAAINYYYPGSGTDVSVPLNLTADGRFNLSITTPQANTSWGNSLYVNVSVPEILNESVTTTEGSFNIAMVFGAGSPGGLAGSTDLAVRDALGLTTTGKINYTANAQTSGVHLAADQAATFFGDAPFYSPRGSYVSSTPSTTAYVISYASKLGRAQHKLANVVGQTNASSGASTVVCTPGTACNIGGGYSVNLPSAAAGGVQQVQLNTAVRPLVVLDSQATTTQPLIVVGGPLVNSVAAQMTAGQQVAAAAPGDYWVVVEGNKLLVAGYTAQDTVDAANDLINWITTQGSGSEAPTEEAPAAG